MHHSDRGCQYTSAHYRQVLADLAISVSMSRTGNCWDNAVAESFFSTLKRELPNDHIFENWQEVDRAVFAYVEGHYHTHRRHSALGYLPPNEYEHLNAA